MEQPSVEDRATSVDSSEEIVVVSPMAPHSANYQSVVEWG